MNPHLLTPLNRLLSACLAASLTLCTASSHAEKADRLKKMDVVADNSGEVDLQNNVAVLIGHVVITKGTMVIRAARIETRETPDGYRTAIAVGSADQPVSFRQKREGLNEFIEGEAERLEYDDKTNVLRLINKASVRQLRGRAVGSEATGALITYNADSELFTVSGSTSAVAAASSPAGRVHFVFTPREGTEAAAEIASQPASTPSSRGGR